MIEILLALQLSLNKPDWELRSGLIYNVAINGADLDITARCLALKTCNELNWFKFLGDDKGQFGFVKMGVATLQGFGIYYAYKKDRKLGRIVAWSLNAAYTGLVIRNWRELNKQ